MQRHTGTVQQYVQHNTAGEPHVGHHEPYLVHKLLNIGHGDILLDAKTFTFTFIIA